MTSQERMDHLLLCRSIYERLIELEFERVQARRQPAIELPFNLPVLLKQFERYIRWTARRSNVIKMPVGTPDPPGGNTGKSA